MGRASRNGRRFDTWSFWDFLDHHRLVVDVFVSERHGGDEGQRYVFTAICEARQWRAQGSDVNALREEADRELRKRPEIEFREVLHVEVEAPTPRALEAARDGERFNVEARMVLSASACSIGETPEEQVSRVGDERIVKGWPKVYDEQPRAEDGGRFLEGRKVGALIDDTPENRAAVLQVRQMLEDAGRRVADLLRPASVQETLRRVAEGEPLRLSGGRRALSPGEEQPR